MRTTHKESQNRDRQDREFERLYRTIPPNYQGAPAGQDARPEDNLDDIFAEQPSGKKTRRKKIIRRVITILAILLALTGLWLGLKFASNIIKVFGWGGIADIFRSEKLRGEDE